MKPLALLCAAAFVAGCGGGLSREEYDKQGGAILRRAVVAIEKDKQAVRDDPRDPAVYRALAKDLRTFGDDLDKLNPPGQLVSRHNRIVDGMRESADLFDDAADALAKGDDHTFQEKADRALKKIESSAGAGGFG